MAGRSLDRASRDRGASQRQLRVGELVRHSVARIFERGDLRDPDLAGVAITVSEVSLSPDLKVATVWIMPLGGIGLDTVLTGLKRAAPHLRRLVAAEVDLRSAPRLVFRADPSFDTASRIDNLLRKPDVARDLVAMDDVDDGEPTPDNGHGA